MNDNATRVVECARCGAPIGARSQTQAACRYCGTVNAIGARPDDRKPAPSPAEEIARLTRLKAQQEHSVPGHVYDLEAFPPVLAAGGNAPWIERNLEALERLWSRAKANAASGIEYQRALLWIVVHLAPLLRSAGKDDLARARLETSLDLLPDAGHRLLARAELARAAIAAGRLDEAAAWLAECDSAPEVLELDSAFRYAAVRLQLARGDMTGALMLVGPEAESIPWARGLAGHALIARVHAYEAQGNTQKAEALWLRGTPLFRGSLLELARTEGLAPRTRLIPLKHQARRLRAQLNRGSPIALVFAGTLWRTALICLALCLLTMIEGCATGKGPLLGATAPIVCPLVCEGCHEPFSYLFWSSSGSGGKSSGHHAVFCDTEAIRPSTMDWSGLMSYRSKFPHQEVPSGAPMLFAVTYLLLFPFCVIPALVLSIRSRRKQKALEQELREELAPLETELAAAGELDTIHVGSSRAGWSFGLWLCVVLFVFMGSCTGIGFTLCTENPPATTSK